MWFYIKIVLLDRREIFLFGGDLSKCKCFLFGKV